MPFVTTPERLALKKGRDEGREEGRVEALRKANMLLLEKRFKNISQNHRWRVGIVITHADMRLESFVHFRNFLEIAQKLGF